MEETSWVGFTSGFGFFLFFLVYVRAKNTHLELPDESETKCISYSHTYTYYRHIVTDCYKNFLKYLIGLVKAMPKA